MRNLIMKMVLFSVLTIPVKAQNDSIPGNSKWGFSISTGFASGGPCSDLNEFVRSEGYNWDLKIKNTLPVVFDVNINANKIVQFGFTLQGYTQKLVWSSDERINSSFKTITASTYMAITHRDILCLSIGPSLNSFSYSHPTGTSLVDNETFLNPGVSFKGSIKIPAKTIFYIKCEVQYSYSGKIDTHYNIENHGMQYTYKTLEAKNLPVSYFYSGIGVGVRMFERNAKEN